MSEVMQNINEGLAIALCKAWNNLDSSYIENCIANDFVYSSQMVLSDLKGKDAFLNYLKAKFKSFKEGVNIVTAELGYYNNKPCIIFKLSLHTPIRSPYGNPDHQEQSPNHPLVSEVVSTLLMEFENSLIKSAIMCVIPGISNISRTGVFPK